MQLTSCPSCHEPVMSLVKKLLWPGKTPRCQSCDASLSLSKPVTLVAALLGFVVYWLFRNSVENQILLLLAIVLVLAVISAFLPFRLAPKEESDSAH